jgi:hypothetical protein
MFPRFKLTSPKVGRHNLGQEKQVLKQTIQMSKWAQVDICIGKTNPENSDYKLGAFRSGYLALTAHEEKT